MGPCARRVLRWDPYLEPDEGDMEFKLTYAGRLLAFKSNGDKQRERSHHVHEIRKCFHKQLKALWADHPVLKQIAEDSGPSLYILSGEPGPPMNQVFEHDGFRWLPMVTEDSGLICKVEVLMLRSGHPSQVVFDIDNRLKTLFDALRKAKSPDELGKGSKKGRILPDTAEENPFYVLLEDDSLITHLAVATDTLLDPLDPRDHIPLEEQVPLVVSVTVRPYRVTLENSGFA